jgi:hypothetical protein
LEKRAYQQIAVSKNLGRKEGDKINEDKKKEKIDTP